MYQYLVMENTSHDFLRFFLTMRISLDNKITSKQIVNKSNKNILTKRHFDTRVSDFTHNQIPGFISNEVIY